MRADILINFVAMYALIMGTSFLLITIPTYVLSYYISFFKKRTFGIPNSVICGIISALVSITIADINVIYY